MLKEFVISNENASILSDPQTIWEYAAKIGEGNLVLYQFPGFYIADSTNKDTSEALAKIKRSDIAHFQIPIGTIYCTDGEGNRYTITDGLNVAKLAKDADKEHLQTAINEITTRKSYFIGDGLVHAEGGVFNVLARYYNNLLNETDLQQQGDLFTTVDNELRLSEKGNNALVLFKHSWDSLPRNTVETCKLNLKPYLIEFYKDLEAGIPPYLETIEFFVKTHTTSKHKYEQAKRDIQELKKTIEYVAGKGYLVDGVKNIAENIPDNILGEKEKMTRILQELHNCINSSYDKRPKAHDETDRSMWVEGINSQINMLIEEINQLRGWLSRRQLESLERAITHGYQRNYLSDDAIKALKQISNNVSGGKEELFKLLDQIPTHEDGFNELYVTSLNTQIENYLVWEKNFPEFINSLKNEVNKDTVINSKQLELLRSEISCGIEKGYLSRAVTQAVNKIFNNVSGDKNVFLESLNQILAYRGIFNESWVQDLKTSIENYHAWKENFPKVISSLKNEIDKGTGISVRRQLELLAQGGYVSFQGELDGQLTSRTIVKPGINFKYLDKVCETFCPLGLADKYNTWKIRRLGRDLELIKYFKNIDGDLLRISANTLGEIDIGGSARQVFDEPTMSEISSIEKVLNYGVPDERRIPLTFVAVSDRPQIKKEKSHTIVRKTDKTPVNKSVPGLRRSDERLLRQLRRQY